MSIRKYRSVEEMPDIKPRRPLDPDNLRIACELSEMARQLHPWDRKPGITKFRSLEEKNRYDQERERERVRDRQKNSRPPERTLEE